MERQTQRTKSRRTRGTGGIYQKHRAGCPKPTDERGRSKCKCPWWISYAHAGRSVREPGGRTKGAAEFLLGKRTGSRDLGLPVIPRAEQLTFDEAAKDVINDFISNGKRSLVVARRRIEKHLTPFFGGRRLAGITAADIRKYIAQRQAETIVIRKERVVDGKTVLALTKPTANATINRELQMLRRVFSLAIQSGRLASRPHVSLLRESPARSGFFERSQVEAVVAHLPEPLRPVIMFAFITGWRLHSEILPLEWRQVDFGAGEVRLLPGQTKNGEGRVFPMTAELRQLLKDQEAANARVKRQGHITPLVFFRMVAEGRGGEQKPRGITAFTKAWRKACVAAGCPGRIPHDLRRSAVRNFVRAGLSEHVAMRLSGHLTPSIFRRYDIISESDLRAAAQALDLARPAGESAARQR
jgi:integrase